jgi:general secretion pathway protein G
MHPSLRRGFTLIEIMVVVVIIGILAALAAVALRHTRERALATRISSDFRQFRTAFFGYSLDHEAWPAAGAAGVIPTGMEGYLSKAYLNTSEPGGAYSWTGSSGQIQFTSISATPSVMQMVDAVIDDGNLGTGAFTGAGLVYQLQL